MRQRIDHMPNDIFVELPDHFSFRHTVYSHGWSELLPFQLDEKNWRLSYVFSRENAADHIPVTISESGGMLRIELGSNPADKKFQDELVRDVRHILRLDDDLKEFYRLAEKTKDLGWIVNANAGRLIRSATVFEDLVKTLCTTNCSWGLTKAMVGNLVEKLGNPAGNAGRSFPTPEAMASQTELFYRQEIKAGYRSPYFAELAKSVAEGMIDPESWLGSDLPTFELRKEMKTIKGVGDYAAENLLKLVGRYDGLALDSWLRSQFYKKHNNGRVCDDRKISEFYDRFGNWRGLAMWCDMTERWLEIAGDDLYEFRGLDRLNNNA